MKNSLIWIEISRSALIANLQIFRNLCGKKILLAPVVKSNAYGHGLTICSKIFREAKAEFLVVNSLAEAAELRKFDTGRILVAGYIALQELEIAVELDLDLIIFNFSSLEKLVKIAKKPVKIQLKIETGLNRQGISQSELPQFLTKIQENPNIKLTGIYTHFADLEDTPNHDFARKQLAKLKETRIKVLGNGFTNFLTHAANSAAALVLPESHLDLVRIGIAGYGLYPSKKIQAQFPKIELIPALTLKTCIAQIKKVEAGEKIGYGRTFEARREMRLAVLPIGYFDGYASAFSNSAYVLIHGKRAKVVGRVCMNITLVDVTEIPEAKLEDEVILLGKSGEYEISAEELAKIAGTINYEIVARLRESIVRIV
jgi:alanine racemase